VLIAIFALVAREALARLLHPQPVHVSVMLTAAVVAFVANTASVLLLRRHRSEDINVRSAFLHLAQDALASVAVVVAAILSRTAIGVFVDPATALLIGIVVLRSALSIVWEAFHTLLEAAPVDVNVEELACEIAGRFPGVQLHHIHAWEVGPGQRVLTAHMKLGVASLLEAESIASSVRAAMREDWGITHATLEAESNGCGREDLLGMWH
jgi:cobalt-zinc-cadmium efflux system protein